MIPRRWVLAALLLTIGCGNQEWKGRGVVREIEPEAYQVTIDHEEIEGLMPAMSMRFHVEGELLQRMQVGRTIEFTLRERGNLYEVIAFHTLEAGG